MKKLLIYGSAFFDVVKVVDAINRVNHTWTILGFLDDTPGYKGRLINGFPILGGRELIPEFVTQAETYFFNNVNGTRADCQQVINMLLSHNCKIPSLIHPAVDLNYVKVGSGCFIPEGCLISANVTIGNYVGMRSGCVISHDVIVEDFVLIGPGATIGGRAALKKGCLIGAGATVKLGTVVGEYSTVGAGAGAIKDVAPYKTVVGVPAEEINKGGGA
jgi:sugar O-acyltransferase (sialic acid O-acetyltransferase NeuD family)